MSDQRRFVIGNEVCPRVTEGKTIGGISARIHKVTGVSGDSTCYKIRTDLCWEDTDESLFRLSSEMSKEECKELAIVYEKHLEDLAAGRSAEDMAKSVWAEAGVNIGSIGLGEKRLAKDVAELNRIRNRISKTLYEAQLAAARLAESLSAIDSDINELQESISMVYTVDEIVK